MSSVHERPTVPMTSEPYYRPPGLGPDCSTERSARIRQRRFDMGYLKLSEPADYTELAAQTRDIYLANEPVDPAMARAMALRHVVENCEVTPEPNTLLIGGENPFFFNLMLPALQADRHSREGLASLDPASGRMRDAGVYWAACFDGHITPGLEFVLGQGISGIRRRIEQQMEAMDDPRDDERRAFYQAALASCESILIYSRRYRDEALRLAKSTDDPTFRGELLLAADALGRVPEQPASTFHEALQSYWIVYILTTLEMGGCSPGGGLGLGRLDQFLYPYYEVDLREGRLTRDQALELMEVFLLCFRHVDYYTWHQVYTPGSQASIGGVTPNGLDASNDLTELVMEASLRIAMPTPYISLRLSRSASERFWQAASNFVLGGLGFPIVNDEALIPAMLRHGRSLGDARDYICSCCYENTIPGREAFNPNGSYLNLPYVLELALNQGRSLRTGECLGCAVPSADDLASFDSVMDAFLRQLHYVAESMVELTNACDRSHVAYRRYPLMSLFIEDCIARGKDVCSGGARYNLTGCIVAGVPNVLNSLAAIRHCVFAEKSMTMHELVEAMRVNFAGHENLRERLLAAPKWGNGDDRVDDLATAVTDAIYAQFSRHRNARGGRWQTALYSFVANLGLGKSVGASADGRMASEMLTRNMNPTWGTDHYGPTAVLSSLGRIDFTQFPNGSALDLRFDPGIFTTPESRRTFTGFLKGFVEYGVMEMQISMVDTESLIAAREHPEMYPNLMVRVAGYSARFIDLPPEEQDEIIGRSQQRI